MPSRGANAFSSAASDVLLQEDAKWHTVCSGCLAMPGLRLPTDKLATLPDPVGFEIVFWIEPKNRVEFLQTAECLMDSPHMVAGQADWGCFEKVGADNVFLWHECWRSRAELEERLESRPVTTLLGAIGVLGGMESVRILEFIEPRSLESEQA